MIQKAISDKISQIVTECVYRIATGVWPIGGRLPPHRRAAEIWEVDPLTVKRAYERLQARGLVESVPKTGVFVRNNATVLDLRRHMPVLDQFFREWSTRILSETDLSVVGSFRYLAYLAEGYASNEPECAFVECTRVQAEQLASNVTRALDIACAPILLSDLADDPLATPPNMRTVFTTGFHFEEVREICAARSISVVQTTVRFSVQRARMILERGDPFTLFALDAAQARLIAREICRQGGLPDIKPMSVQASEIDAQRKVEQSLRSTAGAVVVSPSVWSAISRKLQEDSRVFGYEFEFDTETQAYMARALGMPVLANISVHRHGGLS